MMLLQCFANLSEKIADDGLAKPPPSNSNDSTWFRLDHLHIFNSNSKNVIFKSGTEIEREEYSPGDGSKHPVHFADKIRTVSVKTKSYGNDQPIHEIFSFSSRLLSQI